MKSNIIEVLLFVGVCLTVFVFIMSGVILLMTRKSRSETDLDGKEKRKSE